MPTSISTNTQSFGQSPHIRRARPQQERDEPVPEVHGDQSIKTYLNKWKIQISREYGIYCKRLVLQHIDAIAQEAFENNGKNLTKIIQRNESISEKFADKIEKEIKAAVVVVRKRVRAGMTIKYDLQKNFNQRLFNQSKKDEIDPLKRKEVEKRQRNVQDKTKLSFEEKFNPDLSIPQENFNMQQVHSLEVLAKIYAYHANPTEEKINISVMVGKTMSLVTYRIEKIATFMGHSCYGLKPVHQKNAPPIVLFLGTSPYPAALGAGISVISDFDPLGVGYFLYSMIGAKVKDWLEKNTLRDESKERNKALLCGHSLGGALANYAAVDNPDLVKQVYTYNAPAVSFLAARRWNKLEASKRPDIYNFYNPYDIIPYLGSTRIGKDFACYTQSEQPKSHWALGRIFENHLMCLLDHSTLIVRQKITPKLPTWLQVAFLVPFFFAGLAIITTKRLVFGHSESKPWGYILGPLDWVLLKIIYGIDDIRLRLFASKEEEYWNNPLFFQNQRV